MILELSFAIVGGANLCLERYWKLVDNLIKRYPGASWKKIIDWKHKRGKYIVEIE